MPLLKPETQEHLRNTFKDSALILVYEFIGTTILCSLVANYYNQAEARQVFDNVGLLLGMFVAILFSARTSGSHYNPCITVSYMIGNVQHGNFNRYLGILYIAAQFAGGIVGSIIGKVFVGSKDPLNLQIDPSEFI